MADLSRRIIQNGGFRSRNLDMRTLLESLIIAFSTYSRIPMPRVDWNDENMKYTICFFPLIGLAVGGISWIFMASSLACGFGTILRDSGLTLIPLLVTGGIHMDGLLDTADAVFSYRSREEQLEIMKDSHSGAFAVIWCGAYLMAFFGILSEMELSDMPLLMMVYAASRALSGIALLKFPKAKSTGLLRTFSDKAICGRSAWILAAELAVFCTVMILAALSAGFPERGAAALGTGALGFYLYYRLTKKNFGGITGDLAGCFLCLEELAMAAGIALAP